MTNIERLRPICGRDLVTLQVERGYATADYCWVLGLSMPRLGHLKQEAKLQPNRPLKHPYYALVVRWLLENPEAEPSLRAPTPAVLYWRLRDLLPERLPVKHFGLLFGVEGGTAARLSNASYRPRATTRRICSLLHRTDDAAFIQTYRAWSIMALDEARSRGAPHLFKAKSWRPLADSQIAA